MELKPELLKQVHDAGGWTGINISIPTLKTPKWVDIIVTPDYGVPRGEEDLYFADFKRRIENLKLPWGKIRWHYFYHSKIKPEG